ncbi:MAG: hypothetical protein JKY04_07900 [Sneathiella sp.]|nr:hypothetical protein [Sneathiella sp.]
MDNKQNIGVLRTRYKVLLQQPLPQMDSGENRAYKVEDQRDSNNVLYALVIAPGMPFRDNIIETITAKNTPGMVDLHSHGVVQFDAIDFRYVFVFDLPLGGRVFTEGTGGLSEHVVLGTIVPRLVDVVINLSSRDIPHRNIRADNVFYMEDGGAGVALGECVTTPAGSLQSAVYEPLESANALADGRGEGGMMSDTYALGIMIVHMLGGVLPGEGRTPAELYAAKLVHGTYAVLVPKIPASSRVGFLLAGLLNDDPSRRWNVNVLIRWRDGVYERPRPGFGDRQAPGPLVFEGEEYLSPRVLSLAMTRRPAQAYSLLEGGKVESWVRNSLNDKDSSARLADSISTARSVSGGARRRELQTVSKASSILDYQGALWYRELSFPRGGLGGIVAYSFRKEGPTKTAIAEFLEGGVLVDIIYSDLQKSEGGKRKDDSWVGIGKATECLEFMGKREALGFGLERCLYELNSSLSCMSPVLKGCYVRDVEQLLDLLEVIALKENGKIKPFDRHISAFIATRANGMQKYFLKLATISTTDVDYTLNQISILGRLQHLLSPSPKPGLCLWVKTVMTPLINKIHSDIRREFLKKKLEKVIDSGNIEQVLKEIDLKNSLRRDAKEYDQAIKDFKGIINSISSLENGEKARLYVARKYGHWIASIISIAALLSSMGLSYIYFMR